MKTISKCFLYIAIMCPLGLADLYFALYGIDEGKWIVATLNIIAIVILVFAITLAYKTAKRIEESMRRNIQTVMNLQLFNLMRMAFENRSDFNPNGFGINPKDKEDEVEADK